MLIDLNRHIAHFDLDTFFVSVEVLKDSRLKGKPVAVGGSSDRGVIASCSYEARKFGVHSAMPVRQAKYLCPELIIRQGDFESYSKYSRMVTDVIAENTPLFEQASIDEFYIDMTGMDKFFGSLKYTNELKNKVTKEIGLPISYALASNKLVSKVATNEGKPKATAYVPNGEERDFLNPLNIVKIPGVGKATALQLFKMGIETVQTLASLPVEALQNLMGKHGTDLWRKARGIDESPVVPFREQKSISTENTFDRDTISLDFLYGQLTRMTEAIAFDLRSQNKLTGCVTVKLRYSNFDTVTKQKTIPFTAQDHILLKTARDLFDRIFERRMLIRLIGIRFTQLVPGNYQIRLFEDTQEMIKLYQAIDSIKGQFGERLLMRARGL